MGQEIKQIAVILGAINLDNQKKLLEGMETAAKELNYNLFVFTNYVGTRETEESVMASSQILRLPEYDKFDGVIVVPNTVHNPVALNNMIADLSKLDKPKVCIDRPIDGMSFVGIDSYAAEYEMVEHFIQHGYKDIICVTGALKVSSEAKKRLQAYQDAMKNSGLGYSEKNVYEGAFTYETGTMVGKQLLEENRCPEAVICGNDDMAHGIMDVFKKAGIRIPEDVKIAGFDNGEMSQLNRPRLATVDKNQYGVGYKAVYEIMDVINGKKMGTYILPCKMAYRESCGCSNKEELEPAVFVEELKQKYVSQQVETVFLTDVLRGMITDFAKAREPGELFDVFKEYVSQIGVKTFYLCSCEKDKIFVLPERNLGRNIDVQQVNDNYTPYIEMAAAYEDGAFFTYDKFPKGFVLPEECRHKSGGRCFVVNQIFYQNYCYGYAVCERVQSVVASGLYYSMLMEIGVGLENVRQRMLLKDAVDRLNGMWCYDNMTSLYNRSGFNYEANSILENLKEEDKNVYILFMDADGLKKVNDTLGHEAGDLLIREIGNIVHKNTINGMLGMRYGGDEFVIFGGFADGENTVVEKLVASIKAEIIRVNETRKYPFLVSVSIGASTWKAREVDNLEKLIEKADKEMYEEKRRKKMR